MSATGFLDACGFFPAAGGTADFVVSSAVTGYQTPASAGAANGAVYSYRAQSSDLSQWEIGYGAYATGTTTLARSTVTASSTGSKVNFSAPPSVYITALTADLLDPWSQQPIGVPIPLLDNLVGVAQPPVNSSGYRYIKLTASDAYNTGVLTSESVTGSAPLVVATAVISLSGSPINGATVNLINTERRVLRGGSAGTVEQDALQNITGGFSAAGATAWQLPTGAFATSGTNAPYPASSGAGSLPTNMSFDASRVVRTGTETRAKNIGVTFFLRIK